MPILMKSISKKVIFIRGALVDSLFLVLILEKKWVGRSEIKIKNKNKKFFISPVGSVFTVGRTPELITMSLYTNSCLRTQAEKHTDRWINNK